MKPNIWLFSLVLTTVSILHGCVSPAKNTTATPADKKNIDYIFEVERSYKDVYRHLLEQGRACTQPQFTAKMVVNGDLFEDIKSADVSVVLMGLFSNSPYLVVRVDSIGDSKSRVHVSNKLPRWNNLAMAIKGWIVDGSTNCEIFDKKDQVM